MSLLWDFEVGKKGANITGISVVDRQNKRVC